MILSMVVASLAVAAPVRCAEPAALRLVQSHADPTLAALRTDATLVVPHADSTLVALFESGEDFATFLARATARRAMWDRNWAAAQVDADVLARARSIPGRWRLLVAAVDGCSDSVNTVPYLARLVALVPTLELRIVTPEAGRVFMESHRTPDGRAATPTVVILDAAGNDVGCWVERPAALQAMAMGARAEGTLEEFARDKQGWYDADAGASTLREVVAVIESAARGTPQCGAGAT